MVTMTETAAKKVSELRLEEGKPEWGLRIRVVGGGCSGMSYELGWEDQAMPEDNVFDTQGIKVPGAEAKTEKMQLPTQRRGQPPDR